MYRVMPEAVKVIPGTTSTATFLETYNLDDFQPILDAPYFHATGGTFNVYAFTDTKIHLSWSVEIEEVRKTLGAPIPTGRRTVVDGQFHGPYDDYGVDLTIEHNGYLINQEFFPLKAAYLLPAVESDGPHITRLRFRGPGVNTATRPPTGVDSLLGFDFATTAPNRLPSGRYEWDGSGTKAGTIGEFFVVDAFDYATDRRVDGTRVLLSNGGSCNIRDQNEEWLDILWRINVDEYHQDGEGLKATGKSFGIAGSYSGEISEP
jgi:hypothetical protein